MYDKLLANIEGWTQSLLLFYFIKLNEHFFKSALLFIKTYPYDLSIAN